MGLLSTDHARMGYLTDFVLYGAAAILLAALLVTAAPHGRGVEMLLFAAAGIATWTLVEYLLHRFVLHGMQPFQAWHAEHHRRPRALIGTPPVLSAALMAALVSVPALALNDHWRAGALAFGLLTGLLIYAIVHHIAHHGAARQAWLRHVIRHHSLHHSSLEPNARYGVTSAFWDFIFRTKGPPTSRATS
jgi:sterol desaturase/sphingolipid hydroxylase (fatty acid hydroxylase superfamily)